jgi:prepilin-type processing-associated H-X9-DG protein/prepilin-type N-terminal cleavage/methylation domain-containing protein
MQSRPKQHPRESAFTMVELLVVIGIISVLISILLPALNRAREAAKAVTCASNLRQIGQALTMYCQDNRDYTPRFLYLKSPDPAVTQGVTMEQMHWSGALRRYLAAAASSSAGGGSEGRRQTPLFCPSARANKDRILSWPDMSLSYMPNSAVMWSNYSSDNSTHIKWATIRFKSRQGALGETWLGTSPEWDLWEPSEPNSNIWLGEYKLRGSPVGSRGCIMPWHGGGRLSNILMADWHVEVNVDGGTGAFYRYQGPPY